jgi:hypothetical protein
MSKELILRIANKKLSEANDAFIELMREKVSQKLDEKKKMVAAHVIGKKEMSEAKIPMSAKKLSPEEKKKAQDKLWKEIHSDHPDSDPEIEGTLARIHAARAKQMKEEDTHDVSEGLMKMAINAISGKRNRVMRNVDSHIAKAEKIAGKPGDDPILDSDFYKIKRSIEQSLDKQRVDRYLRTARRPDKKADANDMYNQTIASIKATNWKQRRATGKFPKFKKEETE